MEVLLKYYSQANLEGSERSGSDRGRKRDSGPILAAWVATAMFDECGVTSRHKADPRFLRCIDQCDGGT